MDDLISRQVAISTVLNVRLKCDTNDLDEYRDILLACFEDLPTAEPRKGRDVSGEVAYYCDFKCSLCGADIGIVEGGVMDGGKFNYCPNCGARMETGV